MQISAPGLIRTSIILLSLGLVSCVTAEHEATRAEAPQPESPVSKETEKLAMQRHRTRPDDLKKSDIVHKLILLDRFEYRVPRQAHPKSHQTFKKQGGWSHVKAENITGSHAGYLYTVDRIPGYSGPFPGQKSRSVLAIETRAGSMNTQSDFYLQYGDERGPPNTVPADVWFQFWIYPNHYDDPHNREDQLSAFGHRFKFIYPCNGPYPCAMGNIHWLHTMGYTTGEPYWLKAPNTELYMTAVDPFNTTVRYRDAPEWNQFKIGQTDLSEHIVPNRWTLVKLHYDTSTPSGSFEAWLRPLGGEWKKVAEWIDGYTPNFEWKIPEQNVGGHRVMRIPTTLDAFDSWIYIDDFAMATSEQALPRY
jgi:hypothetical protein